jgi:hypothetical protein
MRPVVVSGEAAATEATAASTVTPEATRTTP